MIARLKECDRLGREVINQSVLRRNPPRPAVREIVSHRLGLTNAFKRTAHNVINKVGDTKSQFAVVSNPVLKILAKLRRED